MDNESTLSVGAVGQIKITRHYRFHIFAADGATDAEIHVDINPPIRKEDDAAFNNAASIVALKIMELLHNGTAPKVAKT